MVAPASEHVPLLGGSQKPAWGKAAIWCCCGVLPSIALITWLWAAKHHTSALHPAVPDSQASHPAWSKRRGTPNSRTLAGRSEKFGLPGTAEQHDWADDDIMAPPISVATGHQDAAEAKPRKFVARLRKKVDDGHTDKADPIRRVGNTPDSIGKNSHDHSDQPLAVTTGSTAKPEASHHQVIPMRVHVVKRVAPEYELAPPQPMLFTAHCTLPLDLSFMCGGIAKTALGAEQTRIQAEIRKHLPSWVQGVNLKYESGQLVAEPTVKLVSRPQHALFGFNPKMRLRCTFEALMRSPKILTAAKLLSEYSGGLCTTTPGTAHCTIEKTTDASQCDPLGDVLISAPL